MAEFLPDHQGGTIKVGALNHVIGNDHCNACHGDFPNRCKCGGLVHREVSDSFKTINTRCDKCGPEYKVRE